MNIQVLTKSFLLLFAIFIFGGNAAAKGMTKVIAHRGHWLPEGSAQNSIRSLAKADSINCFGSEFDVWLTSDDVLVVNHDRKFKDVVIENSPSAEVLPITLDNGERLPRLDDFLDSAKNTDLRLVCELKEHSDKKQEEKAVRMLVEMMEKKGLAHRVDYITFSKEALKGLIKEAPEGTAVYYLEGDLTPTELKEIGSAGPDYSLKTFRKHPEWIDQAKALGQKVNVWTVNDEKDMQWCIDNNVDFITTNYPERLFRLLW